MGVFFPPSVSTCLHWTWWQWRSYIQNNYIYSVHLSTGTSSSCTMLLNTHTRRSPRNPHILSLPVTMSASLHKLLRPGPSLPHWHIAVVGHFCVKTPGPEAARAILLPCSPHPLLVFWVWEPSVCRQPSSCSTLHCSQLGRGQWVSSVLWNPQWHNAKVKQTRAHLEKMVQRFSPCDSFSLIQVISTQKWEGNEGKDWEQLKLEQL